jgi:hypothetical protein
MIELPGQSKGGELVLTLPRLESRRLWLVSMEGRAVDEILKLTSKSKTNKQVKTHFGLLINTVIAEANDRGIDTSDLLKMLISDDLPTGVGLTKDFLHELLYAVCPTCDEEGRRVTLKQMTSSQASNWFERSRNLLASRGFYVEDPDPNWKEKEK